MVKKRSVIVECPLVPGHSCDIPEEIFIKFFDEGGIDCYEGKQCKVRDVYSGEIKFISPQKTNK